MATKAPKKAPVRAQPKEKEPENLSASSGGADEPVVPKRKTVGGAAGAPPARKVAKPVAKASREAAGSGSDEPGDVAAPAAPKARKPKAAAVDAITQTMLDSALSPDTKTTAAKILKCVKAAHPDSEVNMTSINKRLYDLQKAGRVARHEPAEGANAPLWTLTTPYVRLRLTEDEDATYITLAGSVMSECGIVLMVPEDSIELLRERLGAEFDLLEQAP